MSKPRTPITFNRPVIVGNELDYINQAVESMHTAGDGTVNLARLERGQPIGG